MTILLLIISLIAISCTKEVPERERKSKESAEEINIRKTIDNYFSAYNAGDVETAADLLDQGYRGIVSDSVDINGIEEAKDDLLKYVRQYPKGQWDTKIEEITLGDGYAFVLCTSSFTIPGPVDGKNPIYSERSMRVLKRDKIRGWKIFRYLAAPTFTYDDN